MRLLASKYVVSIELIAIYFHSFEIFIIQIGEMAFCKPQFIVIKSNYFQNAQKGECFLERRFRALVLQNDPKSIRTDALTSISRTGASKRYAVTKCDFEVQKMFSRTHFVNNYVTI
jgi:hypothetical protein